MSNVSAKQLSYSGTNEFDLRGLLYDLLNHKRIIITFAAIAVLIGSIYAVLKVPQFQSDIILKVEGKRDSGFGFISSKFSQGSDVDESASVQSALIRSRYILDPVIVKLGLDINAFPYRLPIIGRFFENKNTISVSKLEVPSNYLNKDMKIIYDKPNHFSLYNSDEKLLLQGDVNKLVTNSKNGVGIFIDKIDASIGSRFEVIKYSHPAIIHRLIPQLKISDLGYIVNNTNQKTGILQLSMIGSNPVSLVKMLNTVAQVTQEKDVERKSLEASKTLEFLKQQLPIVKSALADAETKLNQHRALSGRIDIKLQTQSLLSQLSNIDKQIETVRINRLEMTGQYTSEHPFMIALAQKAKVLEEERLQLEDQLKTLPASDQVAINLMRDVKVKNDLYLILLNKIQELEVTKAGTISDVRILSLATIPDESLSSRQGFIILSSLIFGVLLGVVVVLGRKAIFKYVEDPQWIERHLNLINLAIIPFSKDQLSRANLANQSMTKNMQVLASVNPNDLSVEAIRSLRTSLQLIFCSSPNNIVAIVGISPGIGKSFVSSNLAYLLAEAGKRVLLIDGDLRRGHLQNYFSIPRSPGLSDVLNGSATLEETLKETGKANLTLLPVGAYTSKSSELLMTDRFKELIASVSSQFDIVIIDTAPILAITDGVIISSHAGTNLLVVGSNVHQPEEIESTVKRLSNAGIKLQGCIFNNLKPELKNRHNHNYNYEVTSH